MVPELLMVLELVCHKVFTSANSEVPIKTCLAFGSNVILFTAETNIFLISEGFSRIFIIFVNEVELFMPPEHFP